MRKMIFASLIAFGGMGLFAGSSQALPVSGSTPAVNVQSDMVQQAASHRDRDRRHMRRSWDRHRDGDRCRYRSGRCRHYHNGYWYANPWWTLPLIGGSIILNSQRHGLSSRHVAWCEDRYRSYNRRTNTWVAYSGAVRQCVSPYGP